MRIILISALFVAVAVAGASKKGLTRPYRVAIVDGDGALNPIPSHAAHEPVVRVEDVSGKPLPGARVEFDAPKAGPGVTFSSGSTHFSTTTNADGVAKGYGLRNNGVAGGFAVLVHVSYDGQQIAEKSVHQTNVARRMAHIASKPRARQETYPDASMTGTVVGIALGDQFMINGAPTPTNANLAPGSRLQTQNSPVTIYVHDHCEFLIGPHSSVIIQPHLVSVTSGAVRARHFGDCKFGYGGLWVTSLAPNGDAVLALSSEHMEIGSVSGPVQIANEVRVLGTVQPGTVSEFNFASSTAASGATVTAPTSTRTAFMLGTSAGAALAGLGLAVTAIVQPAPAPTSP